MPYYMEKKGNKYKLHLRVNPKHKFSNKFLPREQVIKQLQAIEISKRKRKLHGGGIGDFFRKVKEKSRDIANTITSAPTRLLEKVIPTPERYTVKAETMLKRYGHFKITSMYIRKEPVEKYVMMLANALSLKEVDDLKKKYGIDKFYHLSMVCTVLDDKGQEVSILIEKNDNINIDVYKEKGKNIQILNINLKGKIITIPELLEKTRLSIGSNKFFVYNFATANCGIFIIDILQANGLYQEKDRDFLFQDKIDFTREMSKASQSRMNIITKFGSLFNRLRGGNLKPEKEIRFI